MVDIDDDGDMDLLGGDDLGNVKVFLRNEEGGLHFDGLLEAAGEDLDVVNRAAPETVDWDLDGDEDLLVGSSDGTVRLFINEGSPEEMTLAAPATIQADGEDIWLGTESAPAMGDLNRDGLRDLVVGSVYGELYFYPNIGAADAPEFGAGVRLADVNGEIMLDQYTRPDLADWNGDGYLDIICGQLAARVTLFINPGPGGVNQIAPLTSEFTLLSHWPEPFNAATNLKFTTNHHTLIQLAVFDRQGRVIQSLPKLHLTADQSSIIVNLGDCPAGRYWVRASGDGQTIWSPLTLIK